MKYVGLFIGAVVIVIAVLASARFRSVSPVSTAPGVTAVGAVTGVGPVVVSTPEPDKSPEFKVKYTVALSGGFTVESEFRSWHFLGTERRSTSFLHQKSGSFILFDANDVADRILDRDLCPRVQAAVAEILRLDAAYIASNPSEFVDEDGTRWRRVE